MPDRSKTKLCKRLNAGASRDAIKAVHRAKMVARDARRPTIAPLKFEAPKPWTRSERKAAPVTTDFLGLIVNGGLLKVIGAMLASKISSRRRAA